MAVLRVGLLGAYLGCGVMPLMASFIIQLMDLAFSMDNVVAAVSLSNKLWIVASGVGIGILAMWFAASIFCLKVTSIFLLITDRPALALAASGRFRSQRAFEDGSEMVGAGVGEHIDHLPAFQAELVQYFLDLLMLW